MKHNICLSEKLTGTTCPASATTAAKPKIIMSKARFFNQSWSLGTGTAPATFNKVDWDQEWKVNGDCSGTLTMPLCQDYYTTFGNETAAHQNKIWVARGTFDEAWSIE